MPDQPTALPVTSDTLAAAVQQAREEIAARILAQKKPCQEPGHVMFPKPSCWTCGRNGAFHRAAMIAAGLRDDPELPDQPTTLPGDRSALPV